MSNEESFEKKENVAAVNSENKTQAATLKESESTQDSRAISCTSKRRQDVWFFSKYLYFYVQPLLNKGQKSVLELSDFADVEYVSNFSNRNVNFNNQKELQMNVAIPHKDYRKLGNLNWLKDHLLRDYGWLQRKCSVHCF